METQQLVPQKKVKKQKPTGLIILIVFIIGAIGFVSYAMASDPSNSETVTRQKEVVKSFNFDFGNTPSKNIPIVAGDYIAKIYITGVIQKENKTYNQKWLLDTISDLKSDSKNKGIILFIDSPGGSVYESDELYLALSNYQTTHKPVWTYMASLAASGGYYIACGSTYICANRNTLTGSIGVIAGQSMDLTGLMEKYGIKSKTFTAGKNKNMLNYNSPLTEEQEQIMQSIADECYDQFTTIVSFNRDIPIDQVKQIADGRIYTAKQAQKLKLIDKICSFDEAVAEMKAKNNLTDCEVADYKYIPKTSFYDMLTSTLSNITPLSKSPEQTLIELTKSNITYPAYLYEGK